MKKAPKLVDLLFERPKKGQGGTNVEKGRQSDRNFRSATKMVDEKLPDALKSPGNMKDFLNGPGKDPKVRGILGRGQNDGQPSDEALAPKVEAAPVEGLKPTQNEIEFGKSVGWPLADFKTMAKIVKGGDVAIGPPNNNKIVRSGDLVIDGHHRWSSVFAINPAANIASYDLALPTNDAGPALAMTQLAIGSTLAKGQEVESSEGGGHNILGAGQEEIYNMIIDSVDKTVEAKAGAILGEKVVKQFIADQSISKHFGLNSNISVGDARKKIAEKVSANLAELPNAASGSPPRVDMPQLDTAAGGVPGVVKKLATGQVNFKDPIVQPQKNESKRSDDQLVMERWLQLAGLLKG